MPLTLGEFYLVPLMIIGHEARGIQETFAVMSTRDIEKLPFDGEVIRKVEKGASKILGELNS